MKSNKSSGPDRVPTRVWKEFAYEMAPVVSDIYNCSLCEGNVPDLMKMSLVTPVPKVTPPKKLEEDLRPITLTTPLAKILEGFTVEHLLKQVADKLDIKQFSISGKSTTHALVYLLHCILETLDKGNLYARVFFADFSKGFDLVDHNALLNELHFLKVHNVIVKWLCSFLNNRTQVVRVGTALSAPVTPRGGIPQGTKSAPLLFTILVNRLVNQWPNRIKYVDDTTIFEVIPRCSPSYLQFIVEDISEFASSRGMRLNPKKCNFLKYQPTSLVTDNCCVRIIKTESASKRFFLYILPQT